MPTNIIIMLISLYKIYMHWQRYLWEILQKYIVETKIIT